MESDRARRLVAERRLAAGAFGHLTEAVVRLPFEALGPVKTLLKRYLSEGPWGPADAAALAGAVGSGQGWWERPLDADLTLVFGWDDSGGFVIELRADDRAEAVEAVAEGTDHDPLAAAFDGPVVPEATPSPRTIRFGVRRRLTDGASDWFASSAQADDPRAARLFREFEEVTGVLVGPDFVAVMARRPADWERILRPVLAVVIEEFSPPQEPGRPADGPPEDFAARRPRVAPGGPAGAGRSGLPGDSRRLNRLERAWLDLGDLKPAEPADLARLVDVAAAPDPYRRQVAANLLREADPETAAAEWSRLVLDPAGAVRRATVDAMVDAGRPELRPLLESALADGDAWVRWKALRGLVGLGPGPSRDAIVALADDADFRIRLEVAGALRGLTRP